MDLLSYSKYINVLFAGEKYLKVKNAKTLMRISVDLKRDDISDLNEAVTLITQAIAQRSGQSPTVGTTPTIDQLRQNSPSSQPTSTGLFTPKPAQQAAPTNRWDVNQTTSKPAAKSESSADSFGMLNMLGRKR